MPKDIRISYPVMAQAFVNPISDEQTPTIDGCAREDCGAWGIGVCRITVEVPDLITEDTPAIYDSTTFLSALGCIICGDLEGPQYVGPIIYGDVGAIPNEFGHDDTDDGTLLLKAWDLALPGAISGIRRRTQLEVSLNVGRQAAV